MHPRTCERGALPLDSMPCRGARAWRFSESTGDRLNFMGGVTFYNFVLRKKTTTCAVFYRHGTRRGLKIRRRKGCNVQKITAISATTDSGRQTSDPGYSF